MPDTSQRKASDYLHNLSAKMLRPIIGILMRTGVPFDTFSSVARKVYVDIARREFGIRGRKTNTSRVAMLTGMTRAKVKQVMDEMEFGATPEHNSELERARHASRILLGWHIDKRFVDADNKPVPLPVSGPGLSFMSLYEKYSGKVVPATSLLKELIKVGAIEQLENGQVIAKSRLYAPNQSDPAALEHLCQAICDLASTGSFNLYRNEKTRTRFQRLATNQLVPASQEKAFRTFLEIEGQAFLERVDNWLSNAESPKSDDTYVRIGAGVFEILSDPIKSPNERSD